MSLQLRMQMAVKQYAYYFKGSKLALVEKKNILLTERIDLDYLEILYRSKFMLGKPEEKIIQLEK